jgi:membrane peptidoglycan carboxypeptidase
MERAFPTAPRWWGVLALAGEAAAAGRAVAWGWRGRREPRIFSGPITAGRLTAAGLLLGIFAVGGTIVHGIAEAPAVVDAYRAFDWRTQAIEITDARGRWLGVVPAAMEPGNGAGRTGWEEHRTLALEAVPAGWLDVLVALEDRHAGKWRSWCGIDVVALARAGALAAIGRGRRGGSTLAMQLVRSMRHRAPGADGSWWARLGRKGLEVREGAMLSCTLGGLADRRLQRLLARHLPLVQGTPDSRMGGVLYGLGMAARVLFDKETEKLDLAEQAVLAAAVRRHVLLAPEDDPAGTALAGERWREVRERAATGLRLAYSVEDPAVRAALTLLETMPVPRAQFAGDIAEARTWEPGEAFRLAANPEQRAAALLNGELVTALGELWLRFGDAYRGRIVGLTLTVDAADNLRFKRRIEDALATLEARLGDRLQLRLLSRNIGDPTAQVVLIEADSGGAIRRHYQNTAEPIALGLIWRRQKNGTLAPSERHVGSVAKAGLAVLLGTGDSAAARYCNQRTADGRIHNWDGDAGVGDCDAAGAWHSVGDVFGRSLNLPLLWRLRTVADADLAALADAAGLQLDPGTPPATAWVLGLASAAPSQLLAMIQAIGHGVSGRPAVASRPRIVAGFRVLDENGKIGRMENPPKQAVDLGAYFAKSDTAGFVRHVLSAPLKPGGTLAALRVAGNPTGLHLAKTGTTTTGEDFIRDKWVIGVRETGKDLRGHVLLIGAADSAHHLGQHISGNQLAIILRELWR